MVFKSKFADVKPDERYKDLVSNFFWSQLDKFHDNVLFLDHETGRHWTGAEIKSTCAKLARALIRHGLKAGDDCVTFYKHCDYIQLVALGVLFAGGSICAGHDEDPEREHHYMLSVMRPSFVFVKHELVEETLQCRKSTCPFTIVIMDDDSLDENQFDRLAAAAHKDEAPLLGLHHHLLAPAVDGNNEAQLELNAQLPVQVDPQRAAFVLLTSGSTGRPKPVCRSQRNSLYVCHSLQNASELWDLSQSSVVAAHLALDHGTGIFQLKQCLAQGYKSILINGYQLDTMLDAIRTHRITDLVLGSALVHNLVISQEVAQLLEQRDESEPQHKPLGSLRNLLSVGSTIASAEVVQNFMRKLPQCSVRQAFGMTETGFLFVVPRELALRDPQLDQRCVGFAMPNVEVKLIGRDQSTNSGQKSQLSGGDEISQFEQLGELYVRGPTVSPGYVGEQFAEQARDSFLPDGFYKSNDLCSFGSDGMLRVLGRFSEILCLGDGWKVLPSEIELELLRHPQVKEVAVVGVPNPQLPSCHAPRAYIVPRDGVKVVDCDKDLKLTPAVAPNGNGQQPVEETLKDTVSRQEIFDFIAARFSEPKHLVGGVKFVSELPKISVGKVDKRALKKADGFE